MNTGQPQERTLGRDPLSPAQRIVAGARHLIENWTYQLFIPGRLIQKKYSAFEQLRHRDVQALEIISRLEEIRHRNLACDLEYIKELCEQLCAETLALTGCLTAFHPVRYSLLANYQQKYAFYARLALAEEEPCLDPPYAQALSQPAAEELAGGKGAALSVIHSSLNLPVPPGVVVTTRAFHSFLAHNDLRKFIDRELARLGPDADREYDQVSRRIQERIHEAELPGELRRAVESSLQAQEMDKSLLAVRSSARAEDAQSSFAGQYHSALHVPVQDWEQAYASVLASKYSAHALYYRIRQGYTDRQTPMAVVIMPMLEPEVSGILYTRREHDPFRMDAYMVRGQGQELAAGSSYQAWAGFMTRNGQWEVEEEGRFQLDRDVLHSLYQAGQALDRGFSSAQDVEWVLGPDRRVVIVQSRPLHFYPARASAPVQDHQAPVLGRGQWVSSGQASGNAYRMDSRESPFQLPLGCILLVSALPPELTPALDRVGAVVSEQGSPACHFASVAREAGVPVICRVSGLAGIQDDARISVDADQGLVLSGALFDSAGETRRSPPSGPPAGIQDRLDRALPPIAALHLRQPDTDDFRIQGCRSLHDIVRFAHEAGVREMFSLVGRRGLNRFGAKRLESPLPLVMHLLDVGSGLALGSHKAKAVTVEQITSQPMRSLWSGLSSQGVQWNPQILHYDWDAYEKSGAHFTAVETSTQFSSYAIVARDYVHAMLRFGYHFAVVDAVVSETMEHNYLHFSFKGGGGQDIQRLQRLRIISAVLEKFGFSLRLTADMLEAWFDRRGPTESTANLQILGFVLGKTVLLDMRIESEEHVNRIAAEIVDHIYDFLPV